MLIATVYSQEL